MFIHRLFGDLIEPSREASDPSFLSFLCHMCQYLFRPEPLNAAKKYKLHYNIDDLEASANQLCHLCSLMLSCMSVESIKQLKNETAALPASENGRLRLRFNAYAGIEISPTVDTSETSVSTLFRKVHSLEDFTRNSFYGFDVVTSVPNGISQMESVLFRCPLFMTTINPNSFRLMRKWIQECDQNHPHCSTRRVWSKGSLPTRLLDIDLDRNGGLTVCLVNTGELPKPSRYMTLSHRWSDNIPCLYQNSVVSFYAGIDLDTLPQTFIDAICLTNMLGIRYLWIDSLCIIQDSAEWSVEAHHMCDVYANSFLNIAAIAASNGHGGLNHSRNPLAIALCQVLTTGHANCEDGGWQIYVDTPPLNNRAWVVQERLLAHRALNSAADQVYWECSSLRAPECLPHGPVPAQADYVSDSNLKNLLIPLIELSQGSTKAELFFDTWTQVLRLYTRCDLTRESDRLIAISGIVDMFCKLFDFDKSQYIAGLWKPYLHCQLLWYPEMQINDREVLNGAPSWSWASCGGSVEYAADLHEGFSLISVVEITCSEEPSGQINGGSLRLQGFPCSPSHLLKFIMPVGERGSTIWSDTHEKNKYLTSLMISGNPALERKAKTVMETFLFCPVWQSSNNDQVTGLILEPTGSRGQYKRVEFCNLCLDYDVKLQEDYRSEKLHESRFQAFDEIKGYTIEIV
jgi:Heterokaryon incompatibility protein (HET)